MDSRRYLPLSRVARGDGDAIRDCLTIYGALVWSLARRASTDRADAEDAVQEVFVDLWRSAPRYDPDRAPESVFVAMIARRRLIDRRRSRKRRPDAEAVSDLIEDELATVRIERHAEASHLARTLASLRPEELRTLVLSFSEGLSHEEIARRTGSPLGTVKSQLRRGLTRARAALSGKGVPRPPVSSRTTFASTCASSAEPSSNTPSEETSSPSSGGEP